MAELAATQEASCAEVMALPGVAAVIMLVPFTDTLNPVGFSAKLLVKVKLPAALTPVTAVTGVTPLINGEMEVVALAGSAADVTTMEAMSYAEVVVFAVTVTVLLLLVIV